ncbi:protein of unknown function [Bradyrhizobium vignae]|uniref:Uncharacterized protein n=1 Tax=Bradyrhizobium vignae TaxID=1549949 RepID=A0A2U3Q2E6_9BRAD|nr:protein of unknown function [Bradyrhizobium vignae]
MGKLRPTPRKYLILHERPETAMVRAAVQRAPLSRHLTFTPVAPATWFPYAPERRGQANYCA